ncbi:hypothetical protein P280DRAFT_523270 [Massarina eburnea CBS 473.64]|uniref:CFEM domain-containing protein n=1 Tax=Massarina eburnea CBS 473.64 TaxID=1395130 RepID=A0A6A6RIU0_9PLEO|nr:hypothetical protein P280DRAFT_523270 [Massarina eburnea CBS 473.64]
MKSGFILTSVIAVTAAQSIADLPACSLNCLTTGLGATGCDLMDFACSCNKVNILTPSIEPCVAQACTSSADQTKIVSVLEAICKNAGVPVAIPLSGSIAVSATTSATASVTSNNVVLPNTSVTSSSVAVPITSAASSSTLVSPSTSTNPIPSSSIPSRATSSGSGCVVVTETVTMTVTPGQPPATIPTTSTSRPTVPPSSAPPFPTPSSLSRSSSRVSSGTGTGLPLTSLPPLQSINAAPTAAVMGPVYAGMLGLAALVL